MKTVVQDAIYLKGGSSYITHNPKDAYRVLSGRVLVYTVPWGRGEAGRRSLLCEVGPGSTIPAFAYRDLDYRSWRFCLVALEEASLRCMPGASTLPLRRRFLQGAGIAGVEQEGYENALVDRYRMDLVREDGYFIRTGREKKETRERTDRLIASLFTRKAPEEAVQGDQLLYRMAALLCGRARIPIAPYERVKACSAGEVTLQDIARVSHFPCREVILEEGWYRADAGFLLVLWGEEQEPAACVPRGQTGYLLCRNGQRPVRLTRELAEQCDPRAYMLYRPFPRKKLTGRDFVRYCVQSLSRADLYCVLLLTVVSSLIGLLIPTLNQTLYDRYIPLGERDLILQIGCLIASFMVGSIAFSVVQGLCSFRLGSRIACQVQEAVYYRVFELPERFFRDYESADLAKRIMELGDLASQVAGLVLSLGLSVVTSVFYLVRMFTYSVRLSVASIAMTVLLSALSYGMARRQMKYRRRAMELDGRSDSVLYQFIQGIEKIRIAGIEERALYEYMKPFVEQRKLETRMGRLSNFSGAVSAVSGSLFALVLYTLAYRSPGLTMGRFVGFNSAFGAVSQTIASLVSGLISYQLLKPAYQRVRALLETEPESVGERRLPGEIEGSIDVDHVSFAYSEDAPQVFRDLSLHIRAGEYVGIVGASGCGKSTLLKLLLGFEHPGAGRIYYDNQDMDELDLQELRKRFGVVLQNGELISGSIYENITLTAPQATYGQVQEAVAAVGLAGDVEEMPMGLHTVLSEDCNTISGGQKQRILIARAIINHPRILFFDEATSALDNITQAMVCDTLEKLGGTRVVIAHRLSTIQRCDRILVFEDGGIAEEGDYASLMERKGLFYRLASRQLLEA